MHHELSRKVQILRLCLRVIYREREPIAGPIPISP